MVPAIALRDVEQVHGSVSADEGTLERVHERKSSGCADHAAFDGRFGDGVKMADEDPKPILDYEAPSDSPRSGLLAFVLMYFAASLTVGFLIGVMLFIWKLGAFYAGDLVIGAFLWIVITVVVLIAGALVQPEAGRKSIVSGAWLGACSWTTAFAIIYLLIIISGHYRVRGWP